MTQRDDRPIGFGFGMRAPPNPGLDAWFERQRARDARVAYYAFYDTPEWQRLRYKTLVKFDGTCCACNCRLIRGRMHVDHIKPRSKYPELELDPNNLQVLCEDCNYGKGNLDETDWRYR